MSFLEKEIKARLTEIKNKIFLLWDNRDTEQIGENNFLSVLVRPYLEELMTDGIIYQFSINSKDKYNGILNQYVTNGIPYKTASLSPKSGVVSGKNVTFGDTASLEFAWDYHTMQEKLNNDWNGNSNDTSGASISAPNTNISLDGITIIDDSNTIINDVNTVWSSPYPTIVPNANPDFSLANSSNLLDEIWIRLDETYHVCVISFKFNDEFIHFEEDRIQS